MEMKGKSRVTPEDVERYRKTIQGANPPTNEYALQYLTKEQLIRLYLDECEASDNYLAEACAAQHLLEMSPQTLRERLGKKLGKLVGRGK